jgi:predicted CxxxxCH...CXXCH cytochrome family protein
MKTLRLTPVAVALAAALAACDSSRPVNEVDRDTAGTECSLCHGDRNRSGGLLVRAAPPRDASGNETGPAVGAHQAHVGIGFLCENCHVIPARIDHDGHLQDREAGDVQFGPAAQWAPLRPTDTERVPAYDALTGTCSNVYCHSPTTVAGGASPAPSWRGTLAGGPCGSCHGTPPPTHQATATRCWTCHPATVANPGPDATPPFTYALVSGGGHMNRVLDLNIAGPEACTACHGTAERPVTFAVNVAAPPVPDAGPHLAHVDPLYSSLWLPGAGLPAPAGNTCAACHGATLPTSIDHAFVPPVFVEPALGWNGTTCTTAACHGVNLIGGGAAPAWRGAGQATCGSCHDTPPAAPHPQNDLTAAPITALTQCNQCHPGTVDAAGAVDKDGGLHVNGEVNQDVHPAGWAVRSASSGFTPHGLAALDKLSPRGGLATCGSCHGQNLDGGTVNVSCDTCHDADANGTPDAGWRQACTFCHGDVQRAANRAAPPVGTQAETATSARAVGAHQRHLGNGSTVTNGVACAECHAVPSGADGLAHVSRAVELTWGPVASARGATPGWTGTSCANYCHGQTLPGGPRTSPLWIAPEPLGCNSCHEAAPTTGQHPAVQDKHQLANGQGFACSVCHLQDYASPASSKANHVNGAVNVDTGGIVRWNPANRTCAANCHGGDAEAWGN